MFKKNPTSQKLLLALALVGLAIPLAGCSATPSAPVVPATQPAQTTFSTPDQAVSAFVDALRSNDTAALASILGPGSQRVIFSGDAVADQHNVQDFLRLYDQKHTLAAADNGAMSLTVGSNAWPFPIPLVTDGTAWRFDTPAGLDEILNRRIGENELTAIQTCLAVVDAQRDYAWRNPNGSDLPEYAQQFFSDPGKKNGLYWPTAPGETPSPLGPLVAEATDQGYVTSAGPSGGTQPNHGYLYRMLTSQGSSAPEGAFDYLVDGKMIGGFAIVSYPADYGNSGIMTFIVSYDGIVYQKDLGQGTKNLAESMRSFDPAQGWTPVPPPDTALTEDSKPSGGT
jgi:hypothetical protein